MFENPNPDHIVRIHFDVQDPVGPGVALRFAVECYQVIKASTAHEVELLRLGRGGFLAEFLILSGSIAVAAGTALSFREKFSEPGGPILHDAVIILETYKGTRCEISGGGETFVCTREEITSITKRTVQRGGDTVDIGPAQTQADTGGIELSMPDDWADVEPTDIGSEPIGRFTENPPHESKSLQQLQDNRAGQLREFGFVTLDVKSDFIAPFVGEQDSDELQIRGVTNGGGSFESLGGFDENLDPKRYEASQIPLIRGNLPFAAGEMVALTGAWWRRLNDGERVFLPEMIAPVGRRHSAKNLREKRYDQMRDFGEISFDPLTDFEEPFRAESTKRVILEGHFAESVGGYGIIVQNASSQPGAIGTFYRFRWVEGEIPIAEGAQIRALGFIDFDHANGENIFYPKSISLIKHD